MNPSMTTITQNSQVFNLINFVRPNNMVDLKSFILNFTNEALGGIKKESPLAVITGSFSVIRVMYTSSFERIKGLLFAFVGAKLRPLPSGNTLDSTYLTMVKFLGGRVFAIKFPTFSRTKCSPFILRARNIGRTLKEVFTTLFTAQFYSLIARRVITNARTKLRSIFFKRVLACGTNFHMPIITLAMANVNYKSPPQPLEV